MKIIKLFVLLVFISVLSTAIFGQGANPRISFNKTFHDFNNIKEEDGKVSCQFDFTNTGNAPLIIQQVTSSCGCTIPEWTKTPVMPGSKGYVRATYDPNRRPGPFNKSISVISNTQPHINKLRITGIVAPKPKTIADEYPTVMGPLRLKTNHLAFFNVLNTAKPNKVMIIYNESDHDLKVEFNQVPSHLDVRVVPDVLKAKTRGQIIVEYDAVKKNDFGFLLDRFYFKFDGQIYSDKTFAVTANLNEDFSHLTSQEMLDAPSIELDTIVFNFGRIKPGKVAKFDFNLINKGKNPLLIRKLLPSCGCTAIAPEKTEIAGGEKSKIAVSFDSKGKSGKQYYNITLITNDPKNQSINLKVIGEVLPNVK